MEFFIWANIFSMFLLKLEIYYQGSFQKLSNQLGFLLVVIYFSKKLPIQIKNSSSIRTF